MLQASLLIALSGAASAPISDVRLSQEAAFEEKIPGTVVTFNMVPVPDGEIALGGKKVSVRKLAVAETEVTWDLYDIFAFRLDLPVDQRSVSADTESRPSKPYGAPDRGFGHAGFPALGIHHHAAQKFCQWLSEKTGRKYRLATEAEWEYAARAGQDKPNGKVDEIAWHYDNTEQTQAVKKKKPNPWGLYDTLGNVMEWTIGSDGVPVCKGGSYLEQPGQLSFDWRKLFDADWQLDDAHTPKSRWWLSNGPQVGLRVVCDLP
jgi:hypothetical protein